MLRMTNQTQRHVYPVLNQSVRALTNWRANTIHTDAQIICLEALTNWRALPFILKHRLFVFLFYFLFEAFFVFQLDVKPVCQRQYVTYIWHPNRVTINYHKPAYNTVMSVCV